MVLESVHGLMLHIHIKFNKEISYLMVHSEVFSGTLCKLVCDYRAAYNLIWEILWEEEKHLTVNDVFLYNSLE